MLVLIQFQSSGLICQENLGENTIQEKDEKFLDL